MCNERIGRRLRVADPGLRRAHTAMRTVIAVGSGAGLSFGAIHAFGAPPQLAALAALVALLGCLTVPDGGRPRQAWHLGRLALSAGSGAALGALLTPWPGATYPALLLVVGVAAWSTRWGPLGSAVGLALFVGHLVPLFVVVDHSSAPWLALCAFVGGSAAATTILVVLPRPPMRAHRRLVGSFVASLDLVVDHALASVPRSAGTRHDDRTLRTLASVQGIALAVDATLDELAPTIPGGWVDDRRGQVLRAEVLADHLVWSVLGRPVRPPLDASDEVRRHRSMKSAPEPLEGPRRPSAALSGRALWNLLEVRRALTDTPPPCGESNPLAPRITDGHGLRQPQTTSSTATPKVVQSLLACTVAIAVGLALSPIYWYWAVIGAFVVVTTTPSRGVGARKALDRMLGTAVGAGAGLTLGTVVAGQHSLTVALVALLGFAALWILQSSHTWMMALVTVLIVLGYDLLGHPAIEVLVPRLTETAAGALVGATAVFFVLPVSTRSSVDTALQTVLDALDQLLSHLDRSEAPPSLDVIRALDRAVGELRETTQPLLTNVPIRIRDDVRAVRLLTRAARFHARRLATLADRSLTPLEHELLERVRTRLTHLRTTVGGEPGAIEPSRATPVDAASEIATTLGSLDDRLAAYQTSRGLAGRSRGRRYR